MLEFYSSSNAVVNTRRAVAECLENALGAPDTDCDVIIFHTTMGHDFDEILSEMRRLAPSARIVGCTGSGIIGREGPNETMRALAVMAVRGPSEEFALAAIDSIAGVDPYEVGERIGRDLWQQNSDVNTVLFFPASIDIYPGDRAIQGIEAVSGTGIPIIGGSAFDNAKFHSSFQFLDDRVFEGGAVAVGIADPGLYLIARAHHGYNAIGEAMVVTRSEGNRVYEIDGRPAWPLLARAAGISESADPMSGESVALWAIARELPQELHKAYGNSCSMQLGSILRQPDGSIGTCETCPEGTRLWLAQRDEEKTFEGVDWMTRAMNEESGGSTPTAVFHADCAGRGRFLFNRFLKEEIVAGMQHPLGGDAGVPWLGFYSGGEFCPVAGQNRFHGWTTALFALYRRADTEPADASGVRN